MASGPQTPGARQASARRPARDARRGRIRRPPRRSRAAAKGTDAQKRSDFRARLLAAVPAIALALFLVIEGGLVFTLGLIVLGGVCMHELYAMYARAHPVRIAGLLALAAMLP